MFKDYKRYLTVSIQVYLILLTIIFIMKIVGLDYFGLDVSNPKLINISDYLSKTHLGDLYNFITVYLMFYFYLCLACNKNKLYKFALIGSLLNFVPQCLLNVFYKMDWIYQIWCISIMLFFPKIVDKKVSFKKIIKYLIMINIYQIISLIIRNVSVNSNFSNFLVESILNLDQLLMLAITYNIHFMKGDVKLCGVEAEVGFSSLKKQNYKKSLRKLQKDFSSLDKQEKASYIIYLLLSLFWNLFTVVTVIFIGILNDTVIECIFILSSFWISKMIFKKSFHLKSMLQCFILSNLSYYVLNRITSPIGISILVPIMLGVGLSYVTSKLVKDYKPLYKGMPLEEFDRSILKVVDKDSDKYNICYDFFIKKENAIFLGRKYQYTEDGIRKITARVNNKIKALK